MKTFKEFLFTTEGYEQYNSKTGGPLGGKKPKAPKAPEHQRCDNCGETHHPDNMRAVAYEHGTENHCKNCIGNDEGLSHCKNCETLHSPTDSAEQCPNCTKKDNRHEVRYYEHPHGGDKNHKYFHSSSEAHDFAKKNSYNYGHSDVWHKGENKGTYWQGK